MTDHIFCDKDWIEDFSVVNIEGETDEIRRNHGTARPRLNRGLGLRVLRLLDFIQQVEIDKRTFFDRASHKLLDLHRPAIPAHNNETVGMFVFVAGLAAFGDPAPRRH